MPNTDSGKEEQRSQVTPHQQGQIDTQQDSYETAQNYSLKSNHRIESTLLWHSLDKNCSLGVLHSWYLTGLPFRNGLIQGQCTNTRTGVLHIKPEPLNNNEKII